MGVTEHRPVIWFFAGTDTDVGKTYCAAAVAAELRHSGKRVGVYKPVESGCRRADGQLLPADAHRLWQAAGRPRTLQDVCPQRFEAPLAPPQAARLEGRAVDAELLRRGAACWENGAYDVVLVEGAGGLMSPLADGMLNLDLVRLFPTARLLIVAANRLGAIHQTLATCEAAKRGGIAPAGILLSASAADSDDSAATNAADIARYSDVPVLSEVAFGGTLDTLDWISG